MPEDNESKIGICLRKYERDFKKFPNAVILGKNTLTKLANDGLIKFPQDLRDVHSRDQLITKYGTFDVYHPNEIKISNTKDMENPITFVRQNIFGRLVKPSSYNLAASCSGLSQI